MNKQWMEVGWRIKLGFALFIISIGWPVLLPMMPLLGFSGASIAAFSGAMLVAAEIMMLAGAAIAGKDGFAFIKSKVLGFLKAYGPLEEVGRARYSAGLVLFIAPLLLGWVWPYFGGYLPGQREYPLVYAIGGDVLLLISLFVLGGAFWDKLRALFVHGAYAVMPGKGSTPDVR